jgi:HEAT repeat protein
MEENINIEETNPSKVYALFYSFFLIPFMIAIFGALFFFMFQFLTYEKSTPSDLLDNIQSGSTTKRWQSAFELSNMLDASKIQNKNLFNSKLVALYEKSKYDDKRVRTYLALAMGKTGDQYFGTYLTEAAKSDADLTNRIAAIRSLGMLKYDKSCKILKNIILDSDFDSEKLSAIISLGVIGNRKYNKVLIQMLDYEEANIRWDAAIALAKMGDKSGIGIIINLLDRKYYDSYPSMKDGSGVNHDESDNSIYTAIAISQILIDLRFKEKLIYLAQNDNNIKIREFALKTLNEYYK